MESAADFYQRLRFMYWADLLVPTSTPRCHTELRLGFDSRALQLSETSEAELASNQCLALD